MKAYAIAAIALAMIIPLAGISPITLAQTNSTNQTNQNQTTAGPTPTPTATGGNNTTNNNTGTPILGGIATLNTVQEEGKIQFTITKNAIKNETTVISQNGTVTEVPGGNVTVVDNGTVVVAPDNSTVSTTPTNVTVIEPPATTNQTTAAPCNCSQQQQPGGQAGIPPVQVVPAPGQNVTVNQAPVENQTNSNPNPPVPLPPITNNTTTPTNNQTNLPPQPPSNQTTGNQTGNATNPLLPRTG